MTLQITPEFQSALTTLCNSRDPLFLTGKAGTGKSTLLTSFRKVTTKKIVVLAPTGVAALNVQGETIHSFFRFRSNITVEEARKAGQRLKNTAMYERLDAIVIDEISMVRADLIDCMDQFLRAALKSMAPFGGKQMIWVGDLHQLPPVVTPNEAHFFRDVYESPYFFSSRAVQSAGFDLQIIELTTIYRQEDPVFIEFLNAIRYRSISPDALADLNMRSVLESVDASNGAIYLTSTNAGAQAINGQRLRALDTASHFHEASCSKTFDLKMAPTDKVLELKVGAQVMFVANHAGGLWVNGTLGTITAILMEEKEIEVCLESGEVVVVAPHKWTAHKHVYDPTSQTLQPETHGTFTQFPLKLAWAITIHKSQGKTFSKVVVDFGRGAFAEGQAYVALSRCESLDGLSLVQPLRERDIIVNSRVMQFLEA